MPKLLITFIKLYEPITQYQAIHWDILWGQPSIFMRQWNCSVWNQGVTDDLWQRRACFGRTFSAPSPQVGGNHAVSDCRDHAFRGGLIGQGMATPEPGHKRKMKENQGEMQALQNQLRVT